LIFYGRGCNVDEEDDIGGKVFHWEDQDVGGWTILNVSYREIRLDGMDWIDLAQNMDQWKALMCSIINLRDR
jgi:hypothetical protein